VTFIWNSNGTSRAGVSSTYLWTLFDFMNTCLCVWIFCAIHLRVISI
jgi:hypothetical protein